MINIAILGYGTVGSGVYEIVQKNKEIIKENCGEKIEVKAILDIRDFNGDPAEGLFVSDYSVILNDPDIAVIVEAIGGLEPAFNYTKAALENGKNVVTSNKELVATHGKQLREIAAANNVQYLFEASVGGGIPLIHPLLYCLGANQITEIFGIFNGTTNYILTKMEKDNESFDQALSAAQAQGYAESDPSADVDGIDTCRKVAILASLAFKKDVACQDIPTEGIRSITSEDILEAKKNDQVIKLIGRAVLSDGKVNCEVKPLRISRRHPLANVDDVFNAIMITGDQVGEVMFYGRGAGKLPTASAILADVINIAARGV